MAPSRLMVPRSAAGPERHTKRAISTSLAAQPGLDRPKAKQRAKTNIPKPLLFIVCLLLLIAWIDRRWPPALPLIFCWMKKGSKIQPDLEDAEIPLSQLLGFAQLAGSHGHHLVEDPLARLLDSLLSLDHRTHVDVDIVLHLLVGFRIG